MKCRDAQKLILDYTASADVRQYNPDLDRHLQECNACRRFSELYSAAFQVVAAERVTEENPEFYNNVISRLRAGKANSFEHGWLKINTFQFGTSLTGLAAAVFLGIWLGSRVLAPFFNGYVVREDAASGLQEAYAQEIMQQEASLERLETYFFDNEKNEDK